MLPSLANLKKPPTLAELPKEAPLMKENGTNDFKFEPVPQNPDAGGAPDRRTGGKFPVSMVQTNAFKNMGRTGGVVRLDINGDDRVPEGQELENKEDMTKKTAAYFRGIANPDAPNYVESIITSKFYAVHKPPAIDKVEREPEYETAEEMYEEEILGYLDGMEGFQTKFFLFFSGLIAGIVSCLFIRHQLFPLVREWLYIR